MSKKVFLSTLILGSASLVLLSGVQMEAVSRETYQTEIQEEYQIAERDDGRIDLYSINFEV